MQCFLHLYSVLSRSQGRAATAGGRIRASMQSTEPCKTVRDPRGLMFGKNLANSSLEPTPLRTSIATVVFSLHCSKYLGQCLFISGHHARHSAFFPTPYNLIQPSVWKADGHFTVMSHYCYTKPVATSYAPVLDKKASG